MSLQKQLWQPKLQTFFPMVFGSGKMKDQIILQTNSLTSYMGPGVCGFFPSVKFATSLLALLTGGLNEEYIVLQC